MGKGEKKGAMVTIAIPPSFWDRNCDSTVAGLDAVYAKLESVHAHEPAVLSDLQEKKTEISGWIDGVRSYQQKLDKAVRESAYTDFEHDVKYIYEFTRCDVGSEDYAASMSTSNITKLKLLLESMQQLGIDSKEDRNFIIALVHQDALGIQSFISTLFLGLTNLCSSRLAHIDAWVSSLKSYDRATHIAKFELEQRMDGNYLGIATCSIDLSRKTVSISSMLTAPKSSLTGASRKFLRQFEGDSPGHFILDTIDNPPSWRDNIAALMSDLKGKENTLSFEAQNLDDIELKQKTEQLLREINSFCEYVTKILSSRGWISMESFKDIYSHLDTMKQVVNMEIKCIRNLKSGTELPPETEFRSLQDQLSKLHPPQKFHQVIFDKIKNVFIRMTQTFNDCVQILHRLARYRQRVLVEPKAPEIAVSQLEKMGRSAKVLIQYTAAGLFSTSKAKQARRSISVSELPVLADANAVSAGNLSRLGG